MAHLSRIGEAAAISTAAIVAAAVAVPTGASATPSITWSACTETELSGFDCAAYEVPLDHDEPRGATTTIALARRPADDPAHRIGTLFVNPGGPGGAGRGMVTRAADIASPAVLARFDLVGFDPRGIGGSDPVQCHPTEEEAAAVLDRVTGVPLTAAEISETLAARYEYTEACKANMGPLLTHMSTVNVAQDLDRLRRAVGDDKLTYLGFSYGTLLGATYVNLFPQRVRAVILDGNVDPEQRTDHRLENKFDRAGGFEIALSGFLAACDEAGAACPFAGDARVRFDALRERFRQGPVTIPGLGERTIDDFTEFIGETLYDMAEFPETAATLQLVYEVVFGQSARKITDVTFPKSSGLPSDDAYGFNSLDASLAVNCSDNPLPRNPAAYPAIADRFEAAHRTFGRAEALSEAGCANWPRITERYHGPWNKRTANTVLLLNPTFDPATRYDFALRMSRELGNARLLTLDGFGHTTRYSQCVTDWKSRYLLNGDVPPAGTRCTQDTPPFPG
ncbi:alpha/beta hydrolase [Actinoplanes rectilineatus]|uniref:alpha/beta hydrolase n=1 Tax=Actinoplanes rectilineatus TaxID=113571 RepID=UPI000696A37A|nr:alpha/beta hydrolase [Actinoplanes rectilineatus]